LVVPPKVGATAAIAGSVLLIAGTLLHPMSADPGDPLAAFTEYAADRLWVASHLSQFVGVALMVVGLIAYADSLHDRKRAWMARLGVLFAVAALAGSAMLQAIDGVALKAMVDAWANASPDQKQASYFAALAVRQAEIGTAAYVGLLFGTAVALIASARTEGDHLERWLGWLGVAAGIGAIGGGAATAFTGFSSAAMNVSMLSNLAIVVWMIGMAALIWRRPSTV
jgi:hypothetical protein